jgi:hypothetical protein
VCENDENSSSSEEPDFFLGDRVQVAISSEQFYQVDAAIRTCQASVGVVRDRWVVSDPVAECRYLVEFNGLDEDTIEELNEIGEPPFRGYPYRLVIPQDCLR